MSLQWTLVATFLYVEIAIMIILLLPFISATRWQKIFKSRLVTGLTSYASLYFNVILVALVLLLLDAIREISKYKSRLNTSNDPQHGSLHYGPTMELVKEFRAQRNFYISGTSLFLWFVLKRLVALIQNTAHLEAENKAIKQQAESATRAANSILESASKEAEQKEDNQIELEKELMKKTDEIKQLTNELSSAKLDVETMKKQSKGVADEYDNLLKEHAKVVAKLEKFENGSEPSAKKDN